MNRLCLMRGVYDEIVRTVGSLPAEHGGALGCQQDDEVIRFFRFDDTSRNTGATYSPDHEMLNAMFRTDWNPKGIRLAGFVHSHPSGFARPSAGDLRYARDILAAIPDLPQLFLPIVQTVPDTGSFRLLPFAVVREGDSVACRPVELELLDARDRRRSVPAARQARQRPGGTAPASPPNDGRHDASPPPGPQSAAPEHGQADGVAERAGEIAADRPDRTFDRVTEAYDLNRMSASRVVAVGVGGAAAFLDDLARCGTGEFVLIDGDLITETNLATQQVYRKDLGRPKVTALAERLLDINPAIRVRTVRESLDDIDDSAMRSLCLESIGGPSPEVTLLCGLTDDFFAQARINALALHLGLPSLCAQVWREGRGAEITFTYPGLTPACHRCILSSRYAAFLSEGFINDVTSHGTPIFATTRLNAIKGFVALALLHRRADGALGSSRTRFTGLAERIGNRNLLQIRMDPDLADALGIKTSTAFSQDQTPGVSFSTKPFGGRKTLSQARTGHHHARTAAGPAICATPSAHSTTLA